MVRSDRFTTRNPPASADRRACRAPAPRTIAAWALALAAVVCAGATPGHAQSDDQEQMRGLDEQVQEIKSDVLSISEELNRLEETLLYPSGTQVAIFVALAPGDTMRLDSVRVEIDGALVAHSIYSFKELDALRKGGVQRLYVGNVATGEHRVDVHVGGKTADGEDYSHSETLSFRKGVKPALVGLTLAGPGSSTPPVAVEAW